MKKKTLRKICYALAVGAVCFIAFQCASSSPSDREIRSKVVRISSERGMCSGEQVHAPSGVDYILTASHCKMLGDKGSFSIITEDGLHLERKLIAEDPKSDLLLLEGLPGVRGLDIGLFAWSQEGVRGFTHGHNHDTYTSPGQLLEIQEVSIPLFEIADDADAAARCNLPKYKDVTLDTLFGPTRVCLLDEFEIVTTASIAPGSSGGPVVDDSGALVGVVSASDGAGFGYLVPLFDIKAFLAGY